MSTPVTNTMGTLSASCYGSLQAFANDLVAQLSSVVPGSLSYVISDTAPGADDRDKLWVKTNSGAPVRSYIWYGGAWVWPHEIPASDARRVIFTGEAAAINTLDGGTAAAVTASSGPFWEIDEDLSGRFPLGVGTLESGKSVASGDTGGEEKVTLEAAELPPHTHDMTVKQYANHDSSTPNPEQLLAANIAVTNASITPDVSISGGGDGDAHNNMPPYVGVYFIKRTARIYHKG